jgi:hypothetical protein
MNKSLSTQFSYLPDIQSKYYLYLFIVWPFLSFVTALFNFNKKEGRFTAYMFLIYFGLTFIPIEGMDSWAYALKLKANALLPFSDFFKIVGGLYSSDTSIDIIEPLISFIVSRITDQHSLLFGAFAAFFGFFYLKSINLLHNRYNETPGLNSLVHLIFFAAVIPVTLINGFRMWTAAWVFFYGAYHVILHRDPRYFIISFGAALVHFSFLSVNALLVIYYFAGNRNFIYFPLALISFVLPRLISPYIQMISMRLGGGLQSRINMYTNEYVVNAVQNRAQQSSWFMQIGFDLVFYYLLFSIAVVQIKSRKFIQDKAEKNLFSFLLLFLTFVNFGKSIPSVGVRFQLVFFLFATLYVFLYCLKLPGSRLNFLTILGLFPMALFTAITLRQGSDSINAWILTPGLGLPLFVTDLSLADILFN